MSSYENTKKYHQARHNVRIPFENCTMPACKEAVRTYQSEGKAASGEQPALEVVGLSWGHVVPTKTGANVARAMNLLEEASAATANPEARRRIASALTVLKEG